MGYQSLDRVRTNHNHGAQGKHLMVKGWHSPIVLQIQEETQFLVDQMNGWEDPKEAAGHMMYPMCMLHPNW